MEMYSIILRILLKFKMMMKNNKTNTVRCTKIKKMEVQTKSIM